MRPPYESQNAPIRYLFRIGAVVLIPLGLIFTIIGLSSFFSAFLGAASPSSSGSSLSMFPGYGTPTTLGHRLTTSSQAGFPTNFFYAFIGLPMLAVGAFCFKAGFLRRISGYVAGEAAPVVKDTVHYVADGLVTRTDVDDDEDRDDSVREHDPVERMRTLEQLLKQGMISETEYASKRAEILDEF